MSVRFITRALVTLASALAAAIAWRHFQLPLPWLTGPLLVTAIALNLAHVFHLRGFGGGEALAGQDGVAGAFWTGVLAAFVATPCTGPFMATAMAPIEVTALKAIDQEFEAVSASLKVPLPVTLDLAHSVQVKISWPPGEHTPRTGTRPRT